MSENKVSQNNTVGPSPLVDSGIEDKEIEVNAKREENSSSRSRPNIAPTLSPDGIRLCGSGPVFASGPFTAYAGACVDPFNKSASVDGGVAYKLPQPVGPVVGANVGYEKGIGGREFDRAYVEADIVVKGNLHVRPGVGVDVKTGDVAPRIGIGLRF